MSDSHLIPMIFGSIIIIILMFVTMYEIGHANGKLEELMKDLDRDKRKIYKCSKPTIKFKPKTKFRSKIK